VLASALALTNLKEKKGKGHERQLRTPATATFELTVEFQFNNSQFNDIFWGDQFFSK